MKTKLIISTLMYFLFVSSFAQNKTIVNATNSEISDNLDLRAVASIFGESKDLADFEFRLNDPKEQISNLDLNNDNQVDYLRVIESIEGNVHLIVIQAVLGHDQFQDVATVEIEKDRNNRMQVQVVGDVYMYGRNYIYEPVYVSVPIIYNYFWVPNYHAYYSVWNWGYYPTYYYGWNPYPIFRYRRHIGNHINFNYKYNYVRTRRCEMAYNNYYGRRSNYYERENPNRSFEIRNSGYGNRYDLDQVRPKRDLNNQNSPRINSETGTRDSENPRNTSPRTSEPRNNNNSSPRNYSNETPRNNTNESPRSSSNSSPRNSEPRSNSNSNSSPRNNEGDISGGTRNTGGSNTGSGGRSQGGGRR